MAGYGLRVWDALGRKIFDTTTRTGRAFGSVVLAPGQSATRDLPVTPGKTPWVIAYASGGIVALYDFPTASTVEFSTGGSAGQVIFFYGER
jgi:hypothetical protein